MGPGVERMKLMTSERCVECDALVYMNVYPKDQPGVIIADGCYLDRDGILCITRFNENTKEPDYECIVCGWNV